MKNCSTCDHSLQPQGGWCYMFREEPIVASCAKHTLAPKSLWPFPTFPAFQDMTISSLTPGPDTLVKVANLGLELYQDAQTRVADAAEAVASTASSAAETVADAGSSMLTAASEATSAGLNAVCSVGEVAGDVVSGCADIAGSILD
jgi:hypothetical protein